MANWVSASNEDYWYSFSSGVSYIGGGIWELGTGPNESRFYEQSSSPFAPDPYTYTEGATHFGMRFRLSWNPSLTWNDPSADVRVRIYTNESGYDSYTQTLNFPSNTLTTRNYLIEWIPVTQERIIEFSIDVNLGFFGSDYGSTPLLSNIEVNIGGNDPEERCVLYKTSGKVIRFTQVVVPVVPQSTGTPSAKPVSSTLSKGTWGSPVRYGSRPLTGSSGASGNNKSQPINNNSTFIIGNNIYSIDSNGKIKRILSINPSNGG